MIYLSAGHNPGGKNPDPGAVANGVREADLTIELRNLVAGYLLRMNAAFTIDRDIERLGEYIKRIGPGSGSVVCEFHFNASANERATGTECLVARNATETEKALAKEICASVVNHTGLMNRGVKTEADSQHSRLAILHTGAGISVLPELCFITNRNDLMAYRRGLKALAMDLATILVRYDDMFK